eukprot:gene7819-9627_t
MSAFEDLGVLPEIIKAVEELDWLLPTAIQAEAIPLILGGGDVLAAAETGSGKTGAFALPILQITYETINNKADVTSKSDNNNNNDEGGDDSSSSVETLKWNENDRNPGLAIDGLVCQSREKDWAGVRATKGINQGKYYYEATVRDEGLCRLGWALKRSTTLIGTDKFSWGYGGTGKKSTEGKFENYGVAYGTNDTIGCYIDFDAGIMGFTKNGQDFGEAFSFNKVGVLYPAVVLKNAEMGFNFGDTPFKHQYKDFQPISKANLIKEAATTPVVANPKDSKKSSTTPTTSIRKPLSLIIEPVKELAEQTYSAIINFSKYLTQPKIEPVLCIGGGDTKKSVKDLRRDGDIVVGTPGKLDSMIKANQIDLSNIRFFVLDEADALIQENCDILNYIFGRLPKTNLQVLFFSATLQSPSVINFCEKITRNPTWVDLKGKDYIPELISHAYTTADPEKFDQLWRNETLRPRTDGVHAKDVKSLDRLKSAEQKSEAIKLLKPHLLINIIRAYKMQQAIIFARTRLDCDNIYNFLTFQCGAGGTSGLEGEFSCTVLHGDKGTDQRKQNLEKFKSGEVKFLISTDVASRGIDVSGLPFVINYTLPDTFEDYIHRVGRVGRADCVGLAISIVASHQEKVWYHTCKDYNKKSCNNTNLVEDGGCSIWYDEPSLYDTIKESLGPIELDDTTFRLPGDTGEEHSFGKYLVSKQQQKEYQPHTEELKSRVLELSHLEETIQRNYLSLPISITLKSNHKMDVEN